MPDDSTRIPPVGSDPGDPPILPRRRAVPAKDAAAEAERAYEMADLADSVKALSERLDENFGSGGSAAPATPEPPPRAQRRWKKLAGEPELPTPTLPPGSRGSSAGLAPLRRQSGGRKVSSKPRRNGQPILAIFGAQVFGFGMVALGYLAGHLETQSKTTASPAREPAPKVEAPSFATISRGGSQRTFDAVNSAMASARQGDAEAARVVLERTQREELGVPGSDYRLALLALQRGDLDEAKLRLDCATVANQELPGSCYVRAMLAGAVGDYNRASEECARAAYAEPFSARYLFFWAECLRRNGKLQPAITHLEEALTRPASPAELEYMAFKLRLAKIEAGRTGDFAVEMAGQLSGEHVSPLWLMTAAALELEANRPAAAAEHLQRATQLMPPADFDVQCRDYFFVAHAMEKEMAPYFMRSATPVSPSPNIVAITVDPLSWSLQNADPATWPSAVQH